MRGLNKSLFSISIIIIFAVVGLWVFQKLIKRPIDKQTSAAAKEEADFYWTCPMHPQVHQDHPGECPICHMKLVKVSQQKAELRTDDEKRSSVQATTAQLEILGIQRHQVEKMNLIVRIPISGILLSSSSLAFQVYESDLSYVRPGLAFTGEASTYSEEPIYGTISSVDSIVDPISRTVRIVGNIQKGPRGQISETSFRGELKIELKDRLAIPESSVFHTGKGDLVYIAEDNKFKPKKIRTGLKSEGFYEVLSGLGVGDTISSGPNFLLDSEAKIRGAND